MSNALNLLHRDSILRALDLFVEMGQQAFLERHGFGGARTYFVRHPRTGELCDSKAVVGVAYGLQFGEALGPKDFSGGEATVKRLLERLGFEVMTTAKPGLADEPETRRVWSREEVELLVADHLQMLTLYLNGQALNKTAHRRALMQKLDRRSDASVEFKHRNVSAILEQLQLPLLPGYLPARNAQVDLLSEIVLDQVKLYPAVLQAVDEFVERPVAAPVHPDFGSVKAQAPPKQLRVQEPAASAWTRRGLKRNYAEQELRNRSLGFEGEKFMLAYEQWRLAEREGLGQLASKVRHVSVEEGDGLGYDILSFHRDGSPRYLEVKTTALSEVTPFYVSESELAFARSQPDRFALCRVFDFRHSPRFFELAGPVEQHVHLDPQTWRASLT